MVVIEYFAITKLLYNKIIYYGFNKNGNKCETNAYILHWN